MQVRHVAAILPAEDSAQRRSRDGRFVPPQREQHSTDQVDHQVAAHARAVLLPATPAREAVFIEWDLGRIVQPRVPIQVCGRQVQRRRIFPGARGVVAPQGQLHHFDHANGPVAIQLPGFRAQHRTDALRADLHDAAVFLGGFHHFESLRGGVRHWLFAIDILARVAGVHHHALVPMVGHRRHDAVDIFAVQEFLVAARCGELGIPGDLPGQRVAAIVEVGGRDALHTGQCNRGSQQARALHADADHAEPHPLAGGRRSGCRA